MLPQYLSNYSRASWKLIPRIACALLLLVITGFIPIYFENYPHRSLYQVSIATQANDEISTLLLLHCGAPQSELATFLTLIANNRAKVKFITSSCRICKIFSSFAGFLFLFHALNMLGSKTISLRYIPNIHKLNAAEESVIYNKT